MMKNKAIIPLLLILCVGLVSGVAIKHDPYFRNINFDDGAYTSDQRPYFCCYIDFDSGDATDHDILRLYVDNVDVKNTTSIATNNNTRICLRPNSNLDGGARTWKFGILNNTDTTTFNDTNMTARTITITRFGTVWEVIDNVVVIFSPLLSMVVAVVPILITLVVVGFLVGLLYAIWIGIGKNI